MFGKRFNFISLAGIKIGIDMSWLLIAVLLTWTLAAGNFPFYYPHLSAGTYWLMGFTGMIGLFICIILHELGHALVAKHYKLPVTQITLFIFGGIAEIKKEPPSPKIEFLVAVAGPIVSLLIAGMMYMVTEAGIVLNFPIAVLGVTSYLTWINLIIVVFNLIPAFPLDGGRILRAILWKCNHNLALATKITTRMGAGFGLMLVFLGIFLFITSSFLSGLWITIIGLFLQKAAFSSRTQFYITKQLQGEKVLKFMKKDPVSVSPHLSLKECIDNYVYTSHHHLYPVTDNDELLGYISLQEIKSVPPENWSNTDVRNVMVPLSQVTTVSPSTSALEAMNLIHEVNAATLFVVENGKLVGLLTSQDLFKLILLKLELEENL